MNLNHGKYLGVDYGDVRTGIAECDPSGLIATGITTVKEGGMRNTAERVAREAELRSCKKIVVGLPRNMDGSEGFRAEAVRAFVGILGELTEIPIALYDERMTTMQAYRVFEESGAYGKRRRENIDTLSAQIILQNYIDAERNGSVK